MNFKFFIPILLLSCSLFIFSNENSATAQPSDHEFELYILMGQSNMAGRGLISDSLKILQNEKIWMLTKDLNWVVARHPIHFDKPAVAGVGPGLSFGIAMSAANPGIRIGLVPCAVGGTSIDKWQPGAFDQATSTYPYDDAVIRIKEAMKHGKIKGILWLQGEADSNEAAATQYINKLKVLIGQIRRLTGDKKLPVVIGELGRFKPNYQSFNQVLHQAPQAIRHSAVATSEGLTDKGDRTHFDARSATLYGNRFAEQMLKLQ